MATRDRQSLGRARNRDDQYPGGPSAQQVKIEGVDLADRVGAQESPSGVAGATAAAFRELVNRLNAAFARISRTIGPLQEGVRSAATGPAATTDNAIARWDGPNGTKLQNSYATIDDSGKVVFAGTSSKVLNVRPDLSDPVVDLSSVGSSAIGYMGVSQSTFSPASNQGIYLKFNGNSGTSFVYSSQANLKIESDGGFVQITSALSADILLATANDVVARLSEAAGASKFIVKDNALVEVFAVDSNGNLTLSGTADGRDLATDGTKLDGIESDGTTLAGASNVVSATIASGDIALPAHTKPTVWVVVADTESAASTDDLDHITGGVEGDILTVRQTDSARDVTIKHATAGNGRFNNVSVGDLAFTSVVAAAVYVRRGPGDVWDELVSRLS